LEDSSDLSEDSSELSDEEPLEPFFEEDKDALMDCTLLAIWLNFDIIEDWNCLDSDDWALDDNMLRNVEAS